MAKIWVNRIEAGTKLFSECPARYQEDVKAIFAKKAENGEIPTEVVEEILAK